MISSPGPRGLLLILVGLIAAVKNCSATDIIDTDCSTHRDQISAALQEARSIANYASKRWRSVPAPRKGTLMMDMLGAVNEDDEATFDYAKRQ